MSLIEKGLNDAIQTLADKYIDSNLKEEVRLSYIDDDSFDFEDWKSCYSLDAGEQVGKIRPHIAVGMDMGWQKRSSGRRYDSSSGHAFLTGVLTRKPISRCLKSKFCRICSWYNSCALVTEDAEDVCPPHECMANHTGSAGSMELASLLEMAESLFLTNLLLFPKSLLMMIAK